MKKVPYGKIDYKGLIEDNCYYVDKTMYLEKLENINDTIFYLRPGRFGKSLFTSMISYYYDINSSDLFNNLFKNTYVYKNPTKNKNNYYVLSFDFSGISEAKEKGKLIDSFKECVITGINKFISAYNISYEIDKSMDADDMLKRFLSHVQGLHLDHKLYIIIDEYDNFTNAILEGNADEFQYIVGGIVKSFYANIKIFVKEGVVGKFFATGICPVTLDSMTTGFNIATDISTDRRVNEMIGLTHNEVKRLLEEFVDLKDRDNVYNIMIKNYDGYLFSNNAEEHVFNATLVMYLLRYYNDFKEIPSEVMDKNISFNYGKIGNLITLKNNTFYKELLNKIILNNRVDGKLKDMFNLELDVSYDDIISLLYYFGYLTIDTDEYGRYYFKIPNEVMKVLYGNYFIEKLNENKLNYNFDTLREIENELCEGNILKLVSYTGEVLNTLDNRDMMSFSEQSLKFVMFTLLINNGSYNVYSERVSNRGYIDLYLEKKLEKLPYNIMIELKYIKKKDYSRKILKEIIEEGEEQLLKYGDDKRISNTIKYLVVFVGNELKTLEEVK